MFAGNTDTGPRGQLHDQVIRCVSHGCRPRRYAPNYAALLIVMSSGHEGNPLAPGLSRPRRAGDRMCHHQMRSRHLALAEVPVPHPRSTVPIMLVQSDESTFESSAVSIMLKAGWHLGDVRE